MHTTDQHELPPRIAAIDSELKRLRELAEKLTQLLESGEDAAGSETAALYLQKFYAVCERILILIDREVSGKVSTRAEGHSRLLLESSAAWPGVRPAIITDSSRKLLQKLLAFRKLERNIYGYVPAPYVIEKLSELVLAHQPQLVDEIQWFLSSFLQQRLERALDNRPMEHATTPSTHGLGLILPNA